MNINLEQAVALLRRERIVSKRAVNFILDRGRKEVLAPINYRLSTLQRCAEENKRNHSWFLVYYQGWSQAEQFEFFNGKMPFNDWPRFHRDSMDFLKKAVVAGHEKPRPGYYLLNMDSGLQNMERAEALARIKEKENVRLCPAPIFSEAIISIYLTLDGIRVAENWYHATSSQTDDGRTILVGRNDRNGIDLNAINPDHSKAVKIRYAECLRWEK